MALPSTIDSSASIRGYNPPHKRTTGSTDPSDLTYLGASKDYDLGTEFTRITDILFDSTGTLMVLSYGDLLKEYTLSTPYDVSTASYNGASKDFQPTEYTLNNSGTEFNNDGTKLFIGGLSTQTIYRYTLSTPWEVSSATYDGAAQDLDMSVELGSFQSWRFKPDGTKIFVLDTSADRVYEWSLSTPWDLTTASYNGAAESLSVGTQESSGRAITFNSTGNILYLYGTVNDEIIKYNLGTPWRVNTATYAGSSTDLSVLSYDEIGLVLRLVDNDSRMLYSGFHNGIINQFTFPTDKPYYFAKPIISTSTRGCEIFKTSDPSTVAWSNIAYLGRNTGVNTANRCLSSVSDGAYIHIVHINQTFQLEYSRFNMITDAVEQQAILVADLAGMSAPADATMWCSIALRPGVTGDEVVIAASGLPDADMGSDYERVDLWHGSASGTPSWTGPVSLDNTIVNIHEYQPQVTLGSSDNVHVFWNKLSGLDESTRCRTFDSTNVLRGAVESSVNTKNLGLSNIICYGTTGSKSIAVLGTNENNISNVTIRSAENGSGILNTISTGFNINSVDPYTPGQSGVLTLAYSDPDIVGLYVGGGSSGVDQDLYVNTSTDLSGAWDGESEALDAVTVNYISAAVLDTGIVAYVYDDGGVTKYNEYSLGPASSTITTNATGLLSATDLTKSTSLATALQRAASLSIGSTAALATGEERTTQLNAVMKALLNREITLGGALELQFLTRNTSLTGTLKDTDIQSSLTMTGYLFALLSVSLSGSGTLQSANTLSIGTSGVIQSHITHTTVATAALASVGIVSTVMTGNLAGSIKVNLDVGGALQNSFTPITSMSMALAASNLLSLTASTTLQKTFTGTLTASAQLVFEAIEQIVNASGLLEKVYLPETSVSGTLQLNAVSSLSVSAGLAKVFNVTSTLEAYLYLPVFVTAVANAVLAGTLTKILGASGNLKYSVGNWIPEADSDPNTWSAESQKSTVWS